MANQLCKYILNMALLTNCDCRSHIGAIRHSMPVQ